ncbi:sentrin-specific protease 7-like isoform X2 [Nannospalax galili]|uniref:sentrin-specific protease 7-like isoform X2 n=1 Tax=Nannospalax galili TaxID=1026970 RepID=UPI00111C6874|nr:sentrin-specific protease 7-like isoform X2 [Nannospalax galili]
MDKGRPGRRRSSAEIVTEGKRKKSSSSDLQEITKLLAVKSEAVHAQSPLSKFRGSECWDLPLEGWTRSLRNKVISLDHKNKKDIRGHPVTSKAPPERKRGRASEIHKGNEKITEKGMEGKIGKIPVRSKVNKASAGLLPSRRKENRSNCQKGMTYSILAC